MDTEGTYKLPAHLIPPTVHDRWMSDECTPALVSVIIPTYNRAALLGDAVRSVCEQTHRPLEILLVDDGSTDDTAERSGQWQALCEQHDVQFYFFRQPNSGAPTARNRGMIESRGEFIQFLDSDDLLDADKLEAQVAALVANPASCVCYGLTQYYAADGLAVERFGSSPIKPLIMDAVVAGFDCISPLYRRAELKANGPWDETLRCLQNWEHRARFLLQFGSGIFLDRTVCSHRLHPGPRISSAGNDEFQAGFLQAVLKVAKLVAAVAPDDPQPANHLSRLALAVFKTSLANGQRELARRALDESCRLARGGRRQVLRCVLAAFRVMPTGLIRRLVQSVHARRTAASSAR